MDQEPSHIHQLEESAFRRPCNAVHVYIALSSQTAAGRPGKKTQALANAPSNLQADQEGGMAAR